MAGPGGREVGRVSIRVVPDTDGFRRELQSAVDAAESGIKVEIPVEFDVDTAGLRTQLEALENSKVTIPVNLDLDTAAFRTRLEALDNSRISIPVDLDLQDEKRINAVLARLNRRTININTRLHGVNQAIARLTALDAIIRRLDGRKIDIKVDVDTGGAVAQLGAFEAAAAGASSGGNAMQKASKTAEAGMEGLSRSALRSTGILLAMPPIAAALAVAGAAVTAAWGAVSTAIATIPAALSLVAAPTLAVMAGLDGIKAAAKTIKPEFDAMKAAVSSTFEGRLIPQFKQLATIFPTLTVGLQSMANGVSNISQRLVDMITSAAGVARLNAIFVNIHSTLNAMAPGIAAIVDGFLIVSSQAGAFEALSSAVNTFGSAFRSSVLELVGSGAMTSAFAGLRGLLDNLALGFVNLVHNGIELFATAAPGLNAAIASITDFFGRFNWASLGSSVGGVFQGIADGINSIPQGTIAAIEGEFSRLSTAFQSTAVQDGIRAIADAIPGAISLLTDLTTEFGHIASAVGPAITALADLSREFTDFATSVQTSADSLGKKLGLQGPGSIGEWLAGIDQSLDEALGTVPPKTEQLGTDTAEGWKTGLSGRRGVGGSFGAPLEQELAPIPGIIDNAGSQSANAAERGMAQVPPAAAQGLSPLQQEIVGLMDQLPPSVQAAMVNVANAAGTGTTQVVAAVSQGLTTLGPVASAGMMAVESAINSATLNWNTRLQAAMTVLQTTMSTGLTNLGAGASIGLMSVETAINSATLNWNTRLQAAMTVLQTTMSTGLTNLGAGASIGLMGVETAINSATLNWNTRLQAAMTTLQTTMSTGLTNLGAGASIGLMSVETAINSAVLAWNTRLQAGMTVMQTTMSTGLTTLGASASIGLMAVEMAINSAVLAWNTQLISGMTTMQATVTAGMAAIAAAVTAGMVAVQSAFTVNWAAVAAATTAAMAQIQAVVTAGMTAIVQASVTGWQQMTQAAVTGTQQMVQAITSGAQQMVSALQAAVSQMVGILNAAVGQFRAAGVNMGAALAAGLESQVGRVQAAANRLAQAAAAATRAAAGIRSPSRVFIALGEYMGEGLAVGMRNGESEVERAANHMVNTVVSAAAGLEDIFTGDAWAADLNARMNAELSQHDSSGAMAPRQTVINQNFNVPSAEQASDKALHGMRRLAAFGMFDD